MTAKDTSPQQVAVALRTSVGMLMRRIRQSKDGDELTLPESTALARLDRGGPATAAELARQEQISPQSMGATLAALQERGLIERRPDPRDRRIWRLHLLRPARDVLHEIDEQRADMTRMVTAGIDDHSIEIMTEALMRMKATLTQEAHASRRGTDPIATEAQEAV